MEKSKARQILLFTCVSYFSFGLIWASIGPLLSQFATRNGTSLATIGGIYTAIFLGAVISQIALGRFTDRWGQLRSLTIALLVLSLGIIGVCYSRWLPLTFALAFITGMGQGLANLCGNVLVGQLFKENSVSSVNLLNVFWGIGAFIGPLLVSGAIFLWQSGLPAMIFSALVTIAASLVLLFGFFKVKIGTQGERLEKSLQPKMHYTAFLWSLGGLLLLYIGSESAVGGWATTYMQKTTSLKIELAALVTSGFWLAITLGRIMGTVLGSRLAPKKVLTICLSIASLGGILFVASYGNPVLSIVAIFLIGLGFGTIYPTSMAIVTMAFAETPGQAGSVITVMGSVGGMLIPWLQGIIMQQSGIQAGTYMIAVLIALLVLMFVLNQRAARKD
jgi:FHS family Na+ dependent glucose MFS transporter 1